MNRFMFMCLDAAISAVFLIPILSFLNRLIFRNRIRTVLYVLFAVYLSGMFAVAGLPDIQYIRFDPNCNFRPFAYMFSDYQNSLLNVLLFLPLGIFLPLLWKYFKRGYRTVLFGTCTSLLIEVLQIFTLRATDINDLMTNTFGTILGFLVARLLLWSFPGIRPSWKTGEVWIVCAAAFGTMFFLQPFLANAIFSLL